MYPFFTIFGKEYSAYAVLAILGGIASIVYTLIRGKQKKLNLNDLLYYLTFAFGFLFIGAVLLFQLIEVITNYQTLPYLFKDIEYFIDNWKMGLVFYGGLYGALVGCSVYTKAFKQDSRKFFMYISPVIPLFHMFGRVGCFLVGCCHGMESEEFGIAYTNAFGAENGIPYIPIQLYEAIGDLVIFIILLINQIKVKKYYQPIGIYLTLYGILRFVLEFFRGDEIRGIFGFFSTSQWISLVTIPLGIYCLVVAPEKNFLNRLYTPKIKQEQN